MVVKHNVEGYDNFLKLINDLEKQRNKIYVWFSGSKSADGESWCPDCIQAEPVVEKALSALPDDVHFVHVSVGDRPTWKDSQNPFRRDNRLHLTCVPTLIRWGGAERLEEGDCAKADYVELLLEESS